MSLMHNITSIFVLYYFFSDSETAVESHMDVYESVLFTEFKIFLIMTCFFNLLALLFLGHLIGLHIMLLSKGMSTYEYIRWKQNKSLESKIVRKIKKEEK